MHVTCGRSRTRIQHRKSRKVAIITCTEEGYSKSPMFLSSDGKDFTGPVSALQEQLQHFELLEILEALVCELTKTQHTPVFKNNLSPSPVRKAPEGSAAPRGTSSHSFSIDTLVSIDAQFSVSYVTFLSSVRYPNLCYICHQSLHKFLQSISGL